jgi:predicted HAD superfamily phosphohydrolase
MSKDKLRELLSQLWLQDISADEAFDELEDLINHIKRLEEAGDAMVSHAKALGMDGTGLVKRWSKAKEAKP